MENEFQFTLFSDPPFYDIVSFSSFSDNLAGKYGFKQFIPSNAKSIFIAKNIADAFRFRKRKGVVFLVDYKPKPTLMKRWSIGKPKAVIGIRLNDLIEKEGMERAKELGKLRTFSLLCFKFRLPIVLASFSKDEKELRTAFELINMAHLIGMNEGQAKMALMRAHFLTATI